MHNFKKTIDVLVIISLLRRTIGKTFGFIIGCFQLIECFLLERLKERKIDKDRKIYIRIEKDRKG
jgi:hypothetical protein